jgi:hypothetical protein
VDKRANQKRPNQKTKRPGGTADELREWLLQAIATNASADHFISTYRRWRYLVQP